MLMLMHRCCFHFLSIKSPINFLWLFVLRMLSRIWHINVLCIAKSSTYSRFKLTTDFTECHVLFNTIHSVLELDPGHVHVWNHRTLKLRKNKFWQFTDRFFVFSYFLYAGVWKFISSLATHLYFRQWWRKSTRQPRSQRQRTNIRSRFQALESRQLSLAWVLTSKSCRCIVVWVTHFGCLCERVKRRRNLIIQLRSALRLLCLTWDVRTSIHMRSLCEIWWKINHASSYDHHITAATALVETNYHLNYTPNCHCQILEHNLWRNRDRHSNELKLILLARPRCKHREER